MKITRVSCLVCGWSSTNAEAIENANHYGECSGECYGATTLLRWDYENGEICVTNTETGDQVRLEEVSA